MTDKPPPKVTWKTIERVAAQAESGEMAHLRDMTDEDLDAELKEAGFAPDAAEKLLEAALAKAAAPKDAPPAPPAPVVSLAAERAKRRRPIGWLTLVAAAAAVAVVGGGATLVALNTPSPPPTTPVPSIPSVPPAPPPELLAQQRREKADELRKLARAECDEAEWRACERGLETASGLDPTGDAARAVQRLRRKATRGIVQDELEAKGVPAPRTLGAGGTTRLLAALAPSRGQAVHLVCARGAEPTHLCTQLAAALAKAGWTVTRATTPASDAGDPHGLHLEIATDADDAAQSAADALAAGLDAAPLAVRGPDDVPPASDGSLRLTVGIQ